MKLRPQEPYVHLVGSYEDGGRKDKAGAGLTLGGSPRIISHTTRATSKGEQDRIGLTTKLAQKQQRDF